MSVEQSVSVTVGARRMHRSVINVSIDDSRLVTEARSGSSIAFGKLYERHRLKIHQTTLRILRNAQDAEDATQRSFQRAFMNLAKFRGDSSFSTWLTRVAINEALMLLRERRTNPQRLEGSEDEFESIVLNLADDGPTPEELLAAKELRIAVSEAISQLRKNLRTVVTLRELQGLTSAETARRLGLSVAAVKGRVFHAKRHLRRHLQRRLQTARSQFLTGER